MDPTTLTVAPVSLSLSELYTRLRVREGSSQAAELVGMVAEAESVARPKAAYGVAFIEERGDDYVVVDGVRFSSRVLAVNLGNVNRVFPYVATCGTELERWAAGYDDLLLSYWADAIKEVAMRLAFTEVERHLEVIYGVAETSRMNPGSLADWPIEQQGPLFQLLGDPEETVGVRLTESYLMLPTKSVSGIRFAASSDWENCMLCPRQYCPNRRAKYDPALLEARYQNEARE